MTFLNPTAFWGLLLAVPIIASYLLKHRVRQVPVSTLMFWERAFDERPPRAIGGRLRYVRSLLCQLLLLLLLVLALAHPVSSAGLAGVQQWVLIIDNSSSMQTVQGQASRLSVARETAENIIDGLQPRDTLTILQTTPEVQVLAASTDHKRTLKRAVRRIPPAAGPARLDDALQLASELLRESSNARILVISDRTVKPDPSSHPMQLITTGTASPNLAITNFQVRRSLTDSVAYERLIEVANYSSDSASCSVDLFLNDQLQDVVPLTLNPGAVWRDVHATTSDTAGIFRAELRTERPSTNRLKVDDTAWAVLPAVPRLNVALVTPGNLFLQTALSANETVQLSVSDQLPQTSDHAVMVLHQQVPAQLPDGPVIVIQPTQSTELWQIKGRLPDPLAEITAPKSRLLQHVNLTNVVIPSAVHLEPVAPYESLIEAATGAPLYFRMSRPTGDVFVLCVDLDQSDLPLRTAFPILLSNLISHLAGGGTEFEPAVAAGSSARIDLPEFASDIGEEPQRQPTAMPAKSDALAGSLELLSPSGRSISIVPDPDGLQTPPLDEVGLWKLIRRRTNNESDELQTIACNLMNPDESNVNHVPSTDQESGRPASAAPPRRPAWFLLTVLAGLLLCLEWGLFHRRRIA